MSKTDIYYFYGLLALFALLFLAQVWAITKIRVMLRHILHIYSRMQDLTRQQPRRPSSRGVSLTEPICQNCRHRETFVDPADTDMLVYHCRIHKKRIELRDFCDQFELDLSMTGL